MRETLRQIRAHVIHNVPIPTGDSERRVRLGVFAVRLSLRVIKQWARDRCPQQASALAFQTALSLVPVVAIALTLLRSTGDTGAESNLLAFIAQHVLPDMPSVTAQLAAFSERVSRGALGATGVIFTLVTCYTLYAYVEKIFNDIWRTTRKRSVLGKFLTFYALLTLLPFLAGVSLYWSGKLTADVGALRFFVPLVIQFGALLLTNKLLPTVNVRWSAALGGATMTALALELTKLAFVGFARRMLEASYSGIYGALGLLPMLLLWIYVSWLLILLGAELACAAQNLRLLEAEDRRQSGNEPLNGVVALQLMTAIAADHRRGGNGMSRVELAEAFALTPQGVEAVCARLKARGLVAEVTGDKEGYIPGRAADTIAVADVLAAFRGSDFEAARGETSPVLETMIRDLEAARAERVAGLTISQLIADPDAGPSVTASEA